MKTIIMVLSLVLGFASYSVVYAGDVLPSTATAPAEAASRNTATETSAPAAEGSQSEKSEKIKKVVSEFPPGWLADNPREGERRLPFWSDRN